MNELDIARKFLKENGFTLNKNSDYSFILGRIVNDGEQSETYVKRNGAGDNVAFIIKVMISDSFQEFTGIQFFGPDNDNNLKEYKSFHNNYVIRTNRDNKLKKIL